ncbi:MAG: A24 family peptidase, partial [Pseudomonadota bacterium]
MLWTVVSDLRERRIPNWLNIAVAVLAVVYWMARDVPFWPTMGRQLLIAGGVALVFGCLWLRGMLGGGDLKLHVALALWLPLLPLVEMLVWMGLAGFVLSLIVAADHYGRKRDGSPRVPYGVAISFGAVMVLGEPIINRIAA